MTAVSLAPPVTLLGSARFSTALDEICRPFTQSFAETRPAVATPSSAARILPIIPHEGSLLLSLPPWLASLIHCHFGQLIRT